MLARYQTTCPRCQLTIAAGAPIVKDSDLGRYVHADCPSDPYPDCPDGPGKRAGYGHWNEEADMMWWLEEGRFAGEPREEDWR
jgi:hypothetical protein